MLGFFNMNRNPAVAGSFYPGRSDALKDMVNSFTTDKEPKVNAFGIIAPHAGFIYSGKTAGAVYSRVKIPNCVIVLSPNHSGMGERVAVWDEEDWDIPGGTVQIDHKLTKKVLDSSNLFNPDTAAHEYEHSLEVQLPFLVRFNPSIKMVAITVSHINYNQCEELGKSLATVIKNVKKADPSQDILLVASSDMNHFEDQSTTKKKDRIAIDQVIAMNPKGLLETVGKNRISMCGVIPATIVLIASMELGAKEAELVDYSTSGATSGDYERVVGYAGIVIK